VDEEIAMTPDPTFTPVRRSRLSDALVERIVRSIHDGDVRAGERLPSIAEMARGFRVARATVREALFKLELMRVVEIRHGIGAYVARGPIDDRAA
jgi:GntR family transcriptional repressor for pyruvate dehydrogenase complex